MAAASRPFLADPCLADGLPMRLWPVTLPAGEDYYLCMKQSRRNAPALRQIEKWFRAQASDIMNRPHEPPEKLMSWARPSRVRIAMNEICRVRKIF